MGRHYIQASRAFAEIAGQFNDLGFGDVSIDVLYGDTDSLMIALDFKDMSIERALELGEKMVKKINAAGIFTAPMELAAESVKSPYLLLGPKQYMCMLHKAGEAPQLSETGTVTIRRDNAPLVSRINGTLTKLIMGIDISRREEGIAGIVEYVRGEIEDLLMRRTHWKDLIITQGMTKELEEYAGKQLHTGAVRRWAELRPGSEPVVGDRVPFIVVCGQGEASARSRPPFCVSELGEIPDVHYYLQNKLRNPISKTLLTFISKAECDALFDPRHYDHFDGVTGAFIAARNVTVVRQQHPDPVYAARKAAAAKPKRQLDILEMMRSVSKD